MAAGSADFYLKLSPQQIEQYYRGEATAVQVRDSTGKTIQFPAAMLRRLVTPDGIEGWYQISWDDGGKLVALRKK